MTKGNLRAAISRRYNGAIAEKVIQKLPEFSNPVDFESYTDLIEKLMNTETERLLRIAFDIYDFNSDKLICELDTYTYVQNFSGPEMEDVFLRAFSFDLCLVAKALK